ncbi:MAG: glycerol-3-phosphate acyltransferase [Actinomycetota bacterium]|jgi:glycerol-3-phosphate acyltransferase PlsY|nr:glycerol-3-phosphate acyltransferase [Actinomycetota bacterium]
MWALLLPGAYLLGCLPSAVLVARSRGVDITAVGSGNPGASNVTRVLGWRAGVVVLTLDAAKGASAAGAGLVVEGRPGAYALGAAAIVGHVFPVTNRFRGGKGVATGAGMMLVLHPLVSAPLGVAWFALSRLTGKAALASIAIVVALPFGVELAGRQAWEVLATIGIGVLVMIRHVANVRRLWRREELTIDSGGRNSAALP